MNNAGLIREILRLKEETGTLLLAHTYMNPAIVDIADVSGDSFALSKAATKYDNEKVIMCGVRFMAETVKILSPEKRVYMPVGSATCAMAEQFSPEKVKEFKEQNPDVCVCAYINTTAALKAQCDVCVTSSTAVKIVKALEAKDILFIPDCNLGTFVKEQVPEKNIILWKGGCPVHGSITVDDVLTAKSAHPHAKIAIHPECPPEVCKMADYIGATSGILDYCKQSDDDVIIATEKGVCDWLNLHYPQKDFYQLAPEKFICRDMKLTTLESIYKTLLGEAGEEIILDEELRIAAKRPIDAMLAYGG